MTATYCTDVTASLPDDDLNGDGCADLEAGAVLEEDLTPEEGEAEPVAAQVRNSRPRNAPVPPAHVPADMTLFEYLEQCTPPLAQKIIDIACSQSKVPYDLWQDAAQEIRLCWAVRRPDTEAYKPGQIASYAHRIACNAALATRRELGSSVRLPGSAFRKRKDGSSYVTPGVLARALEWEKLEGWFQTDNTENIEISDNGIGGGLGLNLLHDSGEPTVEDDEEALQREERMDILLRSQDDLTPRQFQVLQALIDGHTYEEVMAAHDIKRGVLMREIAIISSVVGVL